LQFAGAEQWSFAMKVKLSPKDLIQWFGAFSAGAKALVALIDLLGKVVNYAPDVRKFRIFEAYGKG
jgi:hypothetical protein